MSEEPRPQSDRELTLRAIALTYQRARAVQESLGGPGRSSSALQAGDDELDEEPALDDLEAADLPSPIVTDAKLRHHLELATVHQGDAAGHRSAGRLRRVRAALAGREDQLRFNAAIVHALHQLDHRTRAQDRTIRRLEAELAEAHRALAELEAGIGGGR